MGNSWAIALKPKIHELSTVFNRQSRPMQWAIATVA